MGNKQNDLLTQQMSQMQALFQQLLAQAQAKSPLTQAFEQESGDWMKFLKDPSRDFASYKPLGFDLQGAARREELAKRTATGGTGLGEINPALATALKQNALSHQQQTDAVNLEQNVEGYNDAMHGQGLTLANEDQQNRTGLAGLGANMAQSATQNYYQFYKPKRSIWSKLAGIAKIAAPFVTAPFTGGLSLAGAGAGATGGAASAASAGVGGAGSWINGI